MKDEPLLHSSEYDPFNDYKYGGKIRNVKVVSCPRVYPWQTIKAENEDMMVDSVIKIKDDHVFPSFQDMKRWE